MKLSNHVQLLFDDRVVDNYSRLKRTIHQPEMYPGNPVLTPENPWEYGAVLLWGTVIYDEQENIFKMWYMTWGNPAGDALPGWNTPVCYATSQDGVHWDKPRLRLYNFKYPDPNKPNGQPLEHPENNIVYNSEGEPGMDSPTVVKDQRDPNPHRRYKMCWWDRLKSGTGIYNGYSPDGIHWTRIPEMVANAGDRNSFFWDALREKWVIVSRHEATFYEFEQFGVFNNNFWQVRLVCDDIDRKMYPDCRMYSFPVFAYEGVFIGCPELYSREMDRWLTQLAWSYDGKNWHRDPDRVIFMPWSDEPGAFDYWRRNPHNGGVICRGDKLWLYFSGRIQGKEKGGNPTEDGNIEFDPRGIVGSIGLAILRVDGFCSRDSDSEGGSLLTKPVVFEGNRLRLNANIHPEGYIRAAFLDSDQKPIRGFSLAESISLQGDSIDHLVTWSGNENIGALAGKPVRLYLQMKNTELYSFRFTND